jgi:GNAT superfamily N-acetyltransferase
MLTILQAKNDGHWTAVRDLFSEYLHWACPIIQIEYNVTFDAGAILEHDMATLDIFSQPEGRLLLAYDGAEAAGCACMRRIGAQLAEIKRMYVRPVHRRKGIGRALVEAAIEEARAEGYRTLRLDSARFMTDAHALYRSAGFHDTVPYLESEVPQAYHAHWVFMELALADK